jgi:hypothetical protein
MAGTLLRAFVLGVQLATLNSCSERVQCRVSMPYPGLGELGAEACLVSGNGELEDVTGRCGDPAFGKQQVVGEENREDGRELKSYQLSILATYAKCAHLSLCIKKPAYLHNILQHHRPFRCFRNERKDLPRRAL